jgi:UDP-2,3-diacylglucosamine pyrophosphatase LpxH
VLEHAEKMDEDIFLIGQITEMIELSKRRVEKKAKKHICILIKAFKKLWYY